MPVVWVPDSERNRAWLGRTSHHGYPTLELMTLVETGTRSLVGAVFGPTAEGETGYAGRLLHLLRPDMLVLWDKGFDSNAFLARVTDTGAQVLGRPRSNRRTPVLTRLADGSYLSVIGTAKVRIIDAQIAVTCADGTSFAGSYRLVTTLTDARRYPATALVGLYHQRWEHESAYYALRHTIMNGRNLRSGDPGRHRAGDVGRAHPLPSLTHHDGRGRRVAAWHRSGPLLVHRRPPGRP
ncbi:transposase [Streptomyces sp. NPDC005195]|uniref:transposase n=1 Tax=Streptomyces sp. NPDC005195 TaxID=3154561 RepID=UPI0033AA6D3C